jgi:cell division protein FtsI/penicillin-binding protein 2
LSDRGLVTLLGCTGLIVVAGALAVGMPGLGSLEQTAGAQPPPAPVVEASAALPDVAARPNRIVPSSVLERLPSTRAVLELVAVQPPGVAVGRVGETGVVGRVSESVDWQADGLPGPLQVEYTLDAALTREVHRALDQGRVAMGHVIVLEPGSGRVLAYASTDTERFPATRAYPAASLVKVITAAAALDVAPETARLPCRFAGSPYRLTPKQVDPPRTGTTVSFRKALATSNNQCFAQLAVHAVGARSLMEAITRFGWLASPAPAHAAGSVDAGKDRFDTAKLGCGLAGSRITPLHAAQLAASLVDGELVTPRWIDRVIDGTGRELSLPAVAGPRRVMRPTLAAELREMLVDTTTRGTARSAFRRRNGRPKLGEIKVAGKTGSLSGVDPKGKYEWFIGVAPADDPKLAVAAVVVHGDLWWSGASQLAADVLTRAFCDRGKCRPAHAERWLHAPAATASAQPNRTRPSS